MRLEAVLHAAREVDKHVRKLGLLFREVTAADGGLEDGAEKGVEGGSRQRDAGGGGVRELRGLWQAGPGEEEWRARCREQGSISA